MKIDNRLKSSEDMAAAVASRRGSLSRRLRTDLSVFLLISPTLSICAATQVIVWGDNSSGQTNVPPQATNVIQLAGGDSHCLALRTDGVVVTWGGNTYGSTNVPSSATNLVSIGAGSTHSLGVSADGKVYLWGRTLSGLVNTVAEDATNVISAALGPGAQHALVLRADGVAVDWGFSGTQATNVAPKAATNLISVAAGDRWSLGLHADGTVFGWSPVSTSLTNVPASATNIIAIAAGWTHAVALRANGTLLGWGALLPLSVSNIATNIVAIACGSSFSFGLRRDGTVLGWSSGGQISVPSLTNVTGLAASSVGGMVIVSDGLPVLTTPSIDRHVTAGSTAYFSVTAIGALPLTYQWQLFGTNLVNATNSLLALTNVQLSQAGPYSLSVSNAFGGVTSSNYMLSVSPFWLTQPQSTSTYVSGPATFKVVAAGKGPFSYQWQFYGTNLPIATNNTLNLTNVQFADAGPYSVTVSNSFGTVPSSNAMLSVVQILISAQPQTSVAFLGQNVTLSVSSQANPAPTYQWQRAGMTISGATASALVFTNCQYADSGIYNVVLTSGGSVSNSLDAQLSVVPIAAWGFNQDGQTAVPPGLSNVIAIAGGDSHSIALKLDGTVTAWGMEQSTPADLSNVVAIASGSSHDVALKADGKVVAWGTDNSGVTDVPGDLTNALAVDAGDFHNLALRPNGTMVAWGSNFNGQTNIPPGLTNVIAIAAGGSHNLALRADGTVAAWGYNGTGATNVPADLTNVVAIAGGEIHSVALKADGRVVVWGSTANGIPSIPFAATNVVAIAAGYGHCLALRSDGQVLAWGYSYDGEILVPIDLANVIRIAAGRSHSLALVSENIQIPQVRVLNPSFGSSGFSLSLPTRSGHVYLLEYKSSLSDPNWTALPLVAGNGQIVTLTDTTASDSLRFYRVRAW